MAAMNPANVLPATTTGVVRCMFGIATLTATAMSTSDARALQRNGRDAERAHDDAEA
jgi:hypothetical protein